MSHRVAVLRPEPGNAATAARVEAAGLTPIRLPLFAVTPMPWTPPDPARFDALLVTSANAMRLGGAGLDTLRHLPVLAVGDASAAAARDAGFTVEQTGNNDATTLVTGDPRRLLHLAGRERTALPGVEAVTLYGSDPLEVDARVLAQSIALLHSPRAARRLRDVTLHHAGLRATIRIAALSAAVAIAAGDGWAQVDAASVPTDAALVALAHGLVHTGADRTAAD